MYPHTAHGYNRPAATILREIVCSLHCIFLQFFRTTHGTSYVWHNVYLNCLKFATTSMYGSGSGFAFAIHFIFFNLVSLWIYFLAMRMRVRLALRERERLLSGWKRLRLVSCLGIQRPSFAADWPPSSSADSELQNQVNFIWFYTDRQ